MNIPRLSWLNLKQRPTSLLTRGSGHAEEHKEALLENEKRNKTNALLLEAANEAAGLPQAD